VPIVLDFSVFEKVVMCKEFVITFVLEYYLSKMQVTIIYATARFLAKSGMVISISTVVKALNLGFLILLIVIKYST